MRVYRRVQRGKIGQVFTAEFWLGGQKVRLSTGETDKRKAQQVAKQLAAEKVKEAERKRSATGPDMMLSDAGVRVHSERWRHLRDGDKSLRLIERAVLLVGDIKLSQINSAWFIKLREAVEQQGSSPSTANRYCAAVRTVLTVARDHWEILVKVPAVPMTEEKSRARTFTYSDELATKILEDLVNNGQTLMAYLVEFLLLTGLRLSEARLLTWERHVDFERSLVLITPDIAKASNVRTVPLSKKAKEILVVMKEQELAGPFPYSIDAIENQWRAVKKRLSLPKEACLHAFRHTFASRLLAKNVPIYTVQRLLGHSSVVVTERYSHMDLSKLQDAINLMEGVLT